MKIKHLGSLLIQWTGTPEECQITCTQGHVGCCWKSKIFCRMGGDVCALLDIKMGNIKNYADKMAAPPWKHENLKVPPENRLFKNFRSPQSSGVLLLNNTYNARKIWIKQGFSIIIFQQSFQLTGDICVYVCYSGTHAKRKREAWNVCMCVCGSTVCNNITTPNNIIISIRVTSRTSGIKAYTTKNNFVALP